MQVELTYDAVPCSGRGVTAGDGAVFLDGAGHAGLLLAVLLLLGTLLLLITCTQRQGKIKRTI